MSTTSSRNFTTLYSGTGSVVPQGAYGNANVVSLLNVGTDGGNTVGNISATGNVTAAYFIGNGSKLTNITAGNIVGNVNYANTAGLAQYVTANAQANITSVGTLTSLSVSGNINTPSTMNGNVVASTISGVGTANLNISQGGLIDGVNTLNLLANVVVVGKSGGGNSAVIIGPYNSGLTISTNQAGGPQPKFVLQSSGNIDSVPFPIDTNSSINLYGNVVIGQYNGTASLYRGNLMVGNSIYSKGNVSAVGNVTGNYFIGNGSQLTGITTSYGNANVAANLAAFATNPISTSGNITAGYFFGNGSQLTGINAANIVGAYGNANVSDFLANFGSNAISTTGNITANYFIGNGSALTSITGANVTGTVGLAQFVTGNAQANITSVGILTSLSASGNVDAGNIRTAGLVSATGNITGGNITSLGTVTAAGNIGSTQQTVVGTANVGTAGNIFISGRNIATDTKYSPDGVTTATQYTGRVMIGTGWNGNVSVGTAARLATSDGITRTNNTGQVAQFEASPIVSLTGNVSSVTFRSQAMRGFQFIGGGSAANVIAMPAGAPAPFGVSARQFNNYVGNISPYFLGNTSISHATTNGGAHVIEPGSTIGNAFGYFSYLASNSGTPNVSNYIGYTSSINGVSVTGNVYGFYHGNASTLSQTNVIMANAARSAPNYYAFRNDDEVAQVKLGSLRSYNEFQYSTATSGTVNIDKLNSQVQFLNPTANVTIGDFQNFVTTANDGTNNDSQTDTVTLIIQQGATPYTVTMPTGNASIKYSGNVTAVGTTANSVTLVSISAIRSAANAALYLTTVSQEFV